MKYYTYKHTRIDKNEIFYIGVGTKPKRKYKSHHTIYFRAFSKNRTGRGKIWERIIAKTEYIVEILSEFETYEEVLEEEKRLILLYGRINLGTGTLSNLTDGGKGMAGFIHTKESREKMSISKKGTKRDPEVTKRIIETRKSLNYKHSEETRRKMSLAAFARYNKIKT